MRYTFGARIYSKDGLGDGIYTFGELGLPELLSFECLKKAVEIGHLGFKNKILVANSLKEAQEYVKHLSKIYRYEFDKQAKRYNIDKKELRFFLLKLDSLKFKGFEFIPISSAKKDGFPNIEAHLFRLKNKKST